MALQMAYSLDGSGISSIQDFALQTVALYQAGAGTNGYKKGDLVALDATGKIIRVNAGSTKAIGVVEGFEFLGLVAQGQPYAATRASFNDSAQDTTKYPNGVVKVRVETDTVYRVPISGTASSVIAGTAYAIILDAAGDQKLNQASVVNPLLKVVDVDVPNAIAYVTMASNNTF
jgi:hypothetical protein